MKTLLFYCLLLADLAIMGCASSAHAQSMDYGSLQNLFGEPVTTAATGTPQRASEVAANMTIITADEIRQSGSRNIPEILSRVPGLDILQEGVDAFDVGVRGYQQPYNPRLLVLIDGRQVFVDDYSRTAWNNLPVNIDNIRQIEVVKGASSALFGSNATGGVVNIITYSPIYDKTNVAAVSMGTQHTLTGDATATASLGSLGGVSISGGGLDQHEFNTPRGSGEQNAVSPTHRYLVENSVFQVAPDLQANTEITYTESDDQYGVYSYQIYPVRTTAYSLRGGFDWQTPYGTIKNTNYFNHNYTSIDRGTAIGDIPIATNLVVSQVEDQFKIGADHTFRAGFEYRHKELKAENSPATVIELPDLNENVFSLSGAWLWNITDKISATNALRLDHNDMEQNGTLETSAQGGMFNKAAYTQSYDTIAANSGLVYNVTDVDTVRALFGRGVQNPSLIESGLNVNLAAGDDVVGNPNLKPTIVENYELSYDRKVPQIFSTATLSGYFEINRDLKSLKPGTNLTSTFELLSEAINVGNSSGEGLEFEVRGTHPSGFRWDGSYSYQTIRDAALVAQTLGYAKSAPEHHFRALVGYTTGPWEFDTNAQYVTSTAMYRNGSGSLTASQPTTDGYASLAGRIGYKVSDNMTLAVSGTNLTQSQTVASPYPKVERAAFITLTDKF